MYDSETGKRLSLCQEEKILNASQESLVQVASVLSKNASKTTIKKVEDLLLRMNIELKAIYRYYSALGTWVPDEMYTISPHQFLQLMKDCDVPGKNLQLHIIDAYCHEMMAQAQSSTIGFKEFMVLLVQVGVKKCDSYEHKDDYDRVYEFFTDWLSERAHRIESDNFRSLLYKERVQAVVTEFEVRLRCIFHYYAQADLSSPEAMANNRTVNLREYLMFLKDIGLFTINAGQDEKEAKRAADRQKMIEKEREKHNALLAKQGVKVQEGLQAKIKVSLPMAKVTMRDAFTTFSAANLDSDWDSPSYHSIDCEMVFMEFVEGLVRLAYAAEIKKFPKRKMEDPHLEETGKKAEPLIDADTFSGMLHRFFTYIVREFPFWNAYLDVVRENRLLC